MVFGCFCIIFEGKQGFQSCIDVTSTVFVAARDQGFANFGQTCAGRSTCGLREGTVLVAPFLTPSNWPNSKHAVGMQQQKSFPKKGQKSQRLRFHRIQLMFQEKMVSIEFQQPQPVSQIGWSFVPWLFSNCFQAASQQEAGGKDQGGHREVFNAPREVACTKGTWEKTTVLYCFIMFYSCSWNSWSPYNSGKLCSYQLWQNPRTSSGAMCQSNTHLGTWWSHVPKRVTSA